MIPARTTINLSDRVTIVEVGPRDGLQNESSVVPTERKVAFIEALAGAGLPVVEATSFVSPKAVPQLADADEVMRMVHRRPGVRYPVLVPNERGLERALAAGADAIALFTAATEAFARANVGTSVDGTFERFAPVAERARALGIWVRGYVSVAFGCPYVGAVPPTDAVGVATRLFDLGCAEVSLADTIGVATPDAVDLVLRAATEALPRERLALHFHDTGGQALANVAVGLAHGVRIFDSAAGGLGGCPFAPGAPGNLATEALVAFVASRGIETGIDRTAVVAAVADLRRSLSARAPRQGVA